MAPEVWELGKRYGLHLSASEPQRRRLHQVCSQASTTWFGWVWFLFLILERKVGREG